MKPVDSWDVQAAAKMAENITERHGAKPFGFFFTTKSRGDALDSRETARSPMYYVKCKIETLADVKARQIPGDTSDRILISNMECNGWDRIVTTTIGWRFSAPLKATDVVL